LKEDEMGTEYGHTLK